MLWKSEHTTLSELRERAFQKSRAKGTSDCILVKKSSHLTFHGDLQGKVARSAIVCVVQIFRTHIVQIFRTHIVQIYLEHSFAISRLVYASKIV